MEIEKKEDEGTVANYEMAAKAEIIVRRPDGTIKYQQEVDGVLVDQEAVKKIIESEQVVTEPAQ